MRNSRLNSGDSVTCLHSSCPCRGCSRLGKVLDVWFDDSADDDDGIPCGAVVVDVEGLGCDGFNLNDMNYVKVV